MSRYISAVFGKTVPGRDDAECEAAIVMSQKVAGRSGQGHCEGKRHQVGISLGEPPSDRTTEPVVPAPQVINEFGAGRASANEGFDDRAVPFRIELRANECFV